MIVGDQTLGLLSIVTTVELTDNEIMRLDQFVDQFTSIMNQVNTKVKLQSSYSELCAMARHLESVREDERLKISREIHDELGQILSALRMDISIHKQNLNKTVHTPDLNKFLKDADSMINLVDSSIATVREIVRQLRPEMLEKLGIIDTIRSYLDDFQHRTGIECIFQSNASETKLKKEAKLALFRIFQEALTNILRHAEATKVEVSIELQQNFLTLTVKDNGKGFNEETVKVLQSHGILGMKERTALVNGKFRIRSKRKIGTEITVKAPL
jgi:signal transduction histidine kinase